MLQDVWHCMFRARIACRKIVLLPSWIWNASTRNRLQQAVLRLQYCTWVRKNGRVSEQYKRPCQTNGDLGWKLIMLGIPWTERTVPITALQGSASKNIQDLLIMSRSVDSYVVYGNVGLWLLPWYFTSTNKTTLHDIPWHFPLWFEAPARWRRVAGWAVGSRWAARAATWDPKPTTEGKAPQELTWMYPNHP